MLCCVGRKKFTQQENEMKQIIRESRFSSTEINELAKRFQRMSNGQSFLTKQQFRDNMGLLGLETVYFLSDALFAIMDEDMDARIQFNEFVLYFDKITYGDQREKSEISYRLIDPTRKGYFTLKDFQLAMQGLIQSWTVMTGQILTDEVKEHFDHRIVYIFGSMDVDQNEKVSLEEYQDAVLKDPTLLDVFEFLKKGVTETIRETELKKDQHVLDDFLLIKEQSQQLFHILVDTQESKQNLSSLNMKPSQMSSMMLQVNKIKQQNSQIGIKYLFGDDIDAISVKMPSNIHPQQQCQSISVFQQMKSEIHNPGKITGDTDPISKSHINLNFQAQNRQTLSDTHFNLEESLQKMKLLSEVQLRENYRDAIIRVYDLQKQIEQCAKNMDQVYQKRLQEYNSKYHKSQEQSAIRKQVTIQNIHRASRRTSTNLKVQFGHQNWNLVLNMMIGIQMAVKSVNAVQDFDVSDRDFKLKYYFELMPKRSGNDQTNYKICKFYDYAPQVFNQIRKMHLIESESYLGSIGPENLLSSILKGDLSTLSELTSSGKSGSFFYYSQDGTYTLKTISRTEFKFLKQILENYYKHLKKYSQSLIIRLFGMHKIMLDDRKIYFIIMGNVFKTQHEIHTRYDIKGSLYNRTTPPTSDQTVARKDQDFLNQKESLQISLQKQITLLNQINADADFFAANNIIDYSLLLGIHNKSILMSQQLEELPSDSITIVESIHNDKIYIFGIIDILTNFNTKKKLEFCCKRMFQGPTISAIPPSDYAERFKSFIHRIFQRSGSSTN